jgi:ABC-type multidrug transport system fused ATPase/permease subunit
MPRIQLARLTRFLHLDPKRTALHAVCVLGAGVIGASPPLLVGWVIDHLFLPDAPDASSWLWWALPAFVAGSLLYAAFSYGSDYLAAVVSETAANRFQVDLYRHLQRLGADFYQLNRVGEVGSRLTQDIDRGIRPLYTHLVALASGGVMLITTAVALAWVSPVLLGVFAALFALDTFISLRAMPNIFRNFQRLQDDNGALNAQITEAVSVHGLVRAFAREHEAEERMRPLIAKLAGQQVRAERFLWKFLVLLWSFDLLLGPMLLLLVGAVLMNQGASAGTVATAFLYWKSAANFKWNITEGATGVMSGLGAIDRAAAFFDETPLVADAPGAPDLPPGPGEVRFEGVVFHYPRQRDHYRLGPLDLVLPAGRRCALLGVSGSGKTTLAQLVSRIYDPDEGRVLIDGRDLRTVTQSSLRRRVGFMTQDTLLFEGTLRDNLRFARPDADTSAMEDALARAGLAEFLADLPDRLDTLVGERGTRLSGGQRQRLALARLLLLSPELVILDEPTSALDATTEAALWRSIDELLRGRTQLIITHRIATALQADRLAVLDRGRLVGVGAARELFASCPEFRTLCRAQHIDLEISP